MQEVLELAKLGRVRNSPPLLFDNLPLSQAENTPSINTVDNQILNDKVLDNVDFCDMTVVCGGQRARRR